MVYDKEKCRRFVNELGKQSAADIYWPSDEWKGIFTAYVVDKGKKGVINTASDKLQELIDSPFYHEQIKSKLKQEKKEIDDEKITLKDFYDFYNTKNGFKMFHQRIRTAAGLGLMVFSYLLALNKGFMWVSSPGKDSSNKDSVCIYHKTWHKRKAGKANSSIVQSDCNELFPMGTSYLFLLPIPSDLENLSSKSQRQPYMKHQIPEGSSVFSEILLKKTYPVTKIKDAKITSFSNRLVVEWLMEDFGKNIEKIKTEWENLSKDIEDIEKEPPEVKCCNKIIVPKIKSDFDASEIFHILAMVELVSGTRSIILYDISTQTIEDFIRILSIYNRPNIALWSKDCLTLIIPSDFKLPPLIIGGETLKRWYQLNQKISRFYNNDHWLSKLDIIREEV